MDDRDADAFRTLYRRHYRSVSRFLATRTAADHVEDLAAETFSSPGDGSAACPTCSCRGC
jgi:DNA-directed RNA polymerase specialized sigma24 family protein